MFLLVQIPIYPPNCTIFRSFVAFDYSVLLIFVSYYFYKERKGIKKWLKISIIVIAVVASLGGGGYYLLITNPVQNLIGKRVLSSISKRTDSEFTASHISFKGFKELEIENFLIRDERNDTLLYSPLASVVVDSMKRSSHYVELQSLILNSPIINISQKDSNDFNFMFIIDSLSNPEKVDSLRWKVNLKKIQIEQGNITCAMYNKTPVVFNHLDMSTLIDKQNIFIEQLNFGLDNGFNLKKTYADIRISPQSIKIPQLSLTTSNSTLIFRNIVARSTDSLLQNSSLEDIQFNLQSNNSSISGQDISCFLPEEYYFNNTIILDGCINGNMNKIAGTGFHFSIDSIINLQSDFEVASPTNKNRLCFNINLDDLSFDIEELANLYNHIQQKKSIDVSPYTHWKKIAYKGKISGMHDNFSSKGEITTTYGTLNTDLFVFLYDSLQTVEYNGDISTQNFHLGRALQNEKVIGDASAELFISGGRLANGEFGNYFKGEIFSLTVMDYKYKNITVMGGAGKKSFNGNLIVDDKNAKLNFSGKVDFETTEPVFNFKLDMEHLAMTEINLNDSYDQLNLSFNLNSKLKGDCVDDLNGFLNINNLSVQTEYSTFNNDSINCKFKPLDKMPSIALSSEYVNGLILGSYNFTELMGYFNSALKKHLEYLPQFFATPKNATPNDFTFAFEVNDMQNLATTLDLPLQANAFSIVSGHVNSNNNTFDLEGDIPYLLTKKQRLDSVFIDINNNDEHFKAAINIHNFTFNSEHTINNINANYELSHDTMHVSTQWNNNDLKKYQGDYTANIWLEPYDKNFKTIIQTQPSEFFISDTLWHLSKNQIRILPHRIAVDSFRLENEESYFLLDGIASSRKTDKLCFDMEQFDLNNLNRFLSIKDFSFGGIISGKAEFYNLLKTPLLVADISVDDLNVNDSEWGNMTGVTNWDSDENAIKLFVECESPENRTDLATIYGAYYTQDDSLSVEGDFESFDIRFLHPFLERSLSNLKGLASGHLDVRGKLSNPQLYGALNVNDGGFRIDYLSTDFFVNDSIKFDKNRFVFDNVEVQDQDGNFATVTGDVRHTRYKNMLVDIIIESDKFSGLRTTAMENEYFYGNILWGGAITLRTTDTHTYIGSSVKTMSGSHLTVPLSPVSTANSNDFITYVTDEEIEQEVKQRIQELADQHTPQKKLVVDMDVNVTSDATVRIEFDAQSGDVIEAVGNGNINIKFQKGQPFQIYGDYNIDKGYYYFTVEHFLNKSFDVEAGSTMLWSGRPGDAIVNITGQYATRASLYNLMPDAVDENNKNRRTPVNVKMYITKNLSQPEIDFDIELPNTDKETQQSVSSIINTDEEMYRQVLALFMLNSFYTPDYYTSYTENSNQTSNQISSMAAVTVSEFLSNQLSNWMSHISKNVNLGFRYIPEQELMGEGLTPEEYEMALSTQFFDDRLTVNGNVGYQDYAEEARPSNVNSNFVGEVDVELKLNQYLKLKAYSHQNDDILYENSSMKQGAGISYQEDFGTFKELGNRYIKRIGKIFNHKERNNKEATRKKEDNLSEEDKKDKNTE